MLNKTFKKGNGNVRESPGYWIPIFCILSLALTIQLPKRRHYSRSLLHICESKGLNRVTCHLHNMKPCEDETMAL